MYFGKNFSEQDFLCYFSFFSFPSSFAVVIVQQWWGAKRMREFNHFT